MKLAKKTCCAFLVGILTLIVGASIPGCQTTPPEGNKGDEADVATGAGSERFRGRWWSYYQRARRHHADGAFALAEADLRIALKSRSRDSLWPRTYGMHFIPEYFPHRELGINLYFQGRTEDAISELELSLSEQVSARASYYIDLARVDQLETSGADTMAPTVRLSESRGTLSSTRYLLRGVATDDQYVSEILVDGEALYISQSQSEIPFEHEISLAPGDNEVEITVRDLLGKEYSESFSLANDVDGPMVSFDDEAGPALAASGIVFDPAGVTSMRIGGLDVSLEETAPDTFHFVAPLSASGGPTPVRFECEDSLGNVTSGTVPLPNAEVELARGGLKLAAALSPDSAEFRSLMDESVQPTEGWDVAVRIVEDKPIEARFSNIEDGQTFYQDEIILSVAVDSIEPISKVCLLGSCIEKFPPVKTFRMSRRVDLSDGPEHELLLSAVDVNGNENEVRRTIARAPNALEEVGNKLAVTFLPAFAEVPDELAVSVALKLLNIDHKPFEKRFHFVSRVELDRLLREQEISELLAAPNKKLLAMKLEPFEMLFIVRVARVEQGSGEIVVDAIRSEGETGGITVSRAIDVAGPAETLDDFDKRLVGDLATRLIQEFPKVSGSVSRWSSPVADCDLNKNQGMKEGAKCLIYRILPSSNENETKSTLDVLGEGYLSMVGDGGAQARIERPLLNDYPEVRDLPINTEPGEYFVVLK